MDMTLTSLIMIFVGNFFIFIVSLIGAQTLYFKGRWKWFVLTVACVVISGTCMFVEAYQWLAPVEHKFHVYVRQPTTPL
jgi:hypothetical protein